MTSFVKVNFKVELDRHRYFRSVSVFGIGICVGILKYRGIGIGIRNWYLCRYFKIPRYRYRYRYRYFFPTITISRICSFPIMSHDVWVSKRSATPVLHDCFFYCVWIFVWNIFHVKLSVLDDEICVPVIEFLSAELD